MSRTPLPTLLLLSLLPPTLTLATLHPAKRFSPSFPPDPAHPIQKRSITDFCGRFPVDCGSGYCCLAGQTCTTSTPPWCADTLIPGFTIEAAPYGALDSGIAGLSSLGVTLPTGLTATATGTATEGTVTLPSYSDNVVGWTWVSVTESAVATGTESGRAAGRTVGWGGVVVAVGVAVGAG